MLRSNEGLALSVLLVKVFDSVDENLVLVLSEKIDKWLGEIPLNISIVGDVVLHTWKTLLVKIDKIVKRTLVNVESTQGW